MARFEEMTHRGRKVRGPLSDLVELEDGSGGRAVALCFHDAHRGDPALASGLDPIRDFLGFPMVEGLAPLREVRNGFLLYPTGDLRTVRELIAIFAEEGGGGERAALELVARAGAVLVSAAEAAADRGLRSHGSLDPWRLGVDERGAVTVLGYGLPALEVLDFQHDERRIPSPDTLRYCPPERLDGEAEDVTSDLYALSLIAAELCTGAPVYDGADLLDQVSAGEAPDRLGHLPKGLAAVLAPMLLPFPDKRPRSRPTWLRQAEEAARRAAGRSLAELFVEAAQYFSDVEEDLPADVSFADLLGPLPEDPRLAPLREQVVETVLRAEERAALPEPPPLDDALPAVAAAASRLEQASGALEATLDQLRAETAVFDATAGFAEAEAVALRIDGLAASVDAAVDEILKLRAEAVDVAARLATERAERHRQALEATRASLAEAERALTALGEHEEAETALGTARAALRKAEGARDPSAATRSLERAEAGARQVLALVDAAREERRGATERRERAVVALGEAVARARDAGLALDDLAPEIDDVGAHPDPEAESERLRAILVERAEAQRAERERRLDALRAEGRATLATVGEPDGDEEDWAALQGLFGRIEAGDDPDRLPPLLSELAAGATRLLDGRRRRSAERLEKLNVERARLRSLVSEVEASLQDLEDHGLDGALRELRGLIQQSEAADTPEALAGTWVKAAAAREHVDTVAAALREERARATAAALATIRARLEAARARAKAAAHGREEPELLLYANDAEQAGAAGTAETDPGLAEAHAQRAEAAADAAEQLLTEIRAEEEEVRKARLTAIRGRGRKVDHRVRDLRDTDDDAVRTALKGIATLAQRLEKATDVAEAERMLAEMESHATRAEQRAAVLRAEAERRALERAALRLRDAEALLARIEASAAPYDDPFLALATEEARDALATLRTCAEDAEAEGLIARVRGAADSAAETVAQLEAARRADEEARAAKQEAERQAREAKRLAEEEAREARRKAEEDAREARRKAEAEALEAERRRREEEAREAARRAEEEAQEAARRAEAEAQEAARRAEGEARRREEEAQEAARKAEEEARRREEEAREAARKAEEETLEATRRAEAHAQEAAARKAELARLRESARERLSDLPTPVDDEGRALATALEAALATLDRATEVAVAQAAVDEVSALAERAVTWARTLREREAQARREALQAARERVRVLVTRVEPATDDETPEIASAVTALFEVASEAAETEEPWSVDALADRMLPMVEALDALRRALADQRKAEADRAAQAADAVAACRSKASAIATELVESTIQHDDPTVALLLADTEDALEQLAVVDDPELAAALLDRIERNAAEAFGALVELDSAAAAAEREDRARALRRSVEELLAGVDPVLTALGSAGGALAAEHLSLLARARASADPDVLGPLLTEADGLASRALARLETFQVEEATHREEARRLATEALDRVQSTRWLAGRADLVDQVLGARADMERQPADAALDIARGLLARVEALDRSARLESAVARFDALRSAVDHLASELPELPDDAPKALGEGLSGLRARIAALDLRPPPDADAEALEARATTLDAEIARLREDADAATGQLASWRSARIAQAVERARQASARAWAALQDASAIRDDQTVRGCVEEAEQASAIVSGTSDPGEAEWNAALAVSAADRAEEAAGALQDEVRRAIAVLSTLQLVRDEAENELLSWGSHASAGPEAELHHLWSKAEAAARRADRGEVELQGDALRALAVRVRETRPSKDPTPAPAMTLAERIQQARQTPAGGGRAVFAGPTLAPEELGAETSPTLRKSKSTPGPAPVATPRTAAPTLAPVDDTGPVTQKVTPPPAGERARPSVAELQARLRARATKRSTTPPDGISAPHSKPIPKPTAAPKPPAPVESTSPTTRHRVADVPTAPRPISRPGTGPTKAPSKPPADKNPAAEARTTLMTRDQLEKVLQAALADEDEDEDEVDEDEELTTPPGPDLDEVEPPTLPPRGPSKPPPKPPPPKPKDDDDEDGAHTTVFRPSDYGVDDEDEPEGY